MNDDLARLRRYLGLRQIDVSLATGISVSALSAAESGRPLKPAQLRRLRNYYRARLEVLAEAKRAEGGPVQ